MTRALSVTIVLVLGGCRIDTEIEVATVTDAIVETDEGSAGGSDAESSSDSGDDSGDDTGTTGTTGEGASRRSSPEAALHGSPDTPPPSASAWARANATTHRTDRGSASYRGPRPDLRLRAR